MDATETTDDPRGRQSTCALTSVHFSASLPRESHCARCWAPLPALALLRSPINQRHPTHQRSRPPRSTWWRRSTSGGLWRSRSAACTSKSPRFCPPQQRTPTRSNRRPLLSTPCRRHRSSCPTERDTTPGPQKTWKETPFPFRPRKWSEPLRETIPISGSPATHATPWRRSLPTPTAASCPSKRNTSQTNSRRGTDARR